MTEIPEIDNDSTFYINRGQNDGTINLNRRNDSLMPTGRFCCEMPDATEKMMYICVTVTGISTG